MYLIHPHKKEGIMPCLTIEINGEKIEFNDDELNTASQKAIYYLQQLEGDPLDE